MKIKKVIPTKSGYKAVTKKGEFLVKYVKPSIDDKLKVEGEVMYLNGLFVQDDSGTLLKAEHVTDEV